MELPSVNVNIKLLYLIVCENKNDYVIGQWLLARVKGEKEEIYRKHDFRIWRIKLELIKKKYIHIYSWNEKKMAGSESTDDMNFNFNLIISVYEKPHQQNHNRWLKNGAHVNEMFHFMIIISYGSESAACSNLLFPVKYATKLYVFNHNQKGVIMILTSSVWLLLAV